MEYMYLNLDKHLFDINKESCGSAPVPPQLTLWSWWRVSPGSSARISWPLPTNLRSVLSTRRYCVHMYTLRNYPNITRIFFCLDNGPTVNAVHWLIFLAEYYTHVDAYTVKAFYIKQSVPVLSFLVLNFSLCWQLDPAECAEVALVPGCLHAPWLPTERWSGNQGTWTPSEGRLPSTPILSTLLQGPESRQYTGLWSPTLAIVHT
jgi:hypothetical protein